MTLKEAPSYAHITPPSILGSPRKGVLPYTDEEFEALRLNDFFKLVPWARSNERDRFEWIKDVLRNPVDLLTAKRRAAFTKVFPIIDRAGVNLHTVSSMGKESGVRQAKTSLHLPQEVSAQPIDIDGEEQWLDLLGLVQSPATLIRIVEALKEDPAISTDEASEVREFCEKILNVDGFVETCEEIKRMERGLEMLSHRWGKWKSLDQTEVAKLERLRRYFPLHKILLDFAAEARIADAFDQVKYFTDARKSPQLMNSGNTGTLEGTDHLGYRDIEKDLNGGILNDVKWDQEGHLLTLISGEGSGGKSTLLRAVGMNVLLSSAGFAAAAENARLSQVRRVWPYIIAGDTKDAGRFETQERYKRTMCENATPEDLLLIDEPSQGTELEAVRELTRALMRDFVLECKIPCFMVTHDLALVHEFSGHPNVHCIRTAYPKRGEQKYTFYSGIAEAGYGMRHAKALGTDSDGLKALVKARGLN